MTQGSVGYGAKHSAYLIRSVVYAVFIIGTLGAVNGGFCNFVNQEMPDFFRKCRKTVLHHDASAFSVEIIKLYAEVLILYHILRL